LNDRDPFIRFETAYSVIARSGATKQSPVGLHDKNFTVLDGIVWALTDNRLDTAFAKETARAVSKEAQALYLKLSKSDPIQAELRGGLLTLIGQADLPEFYSFLREQVQSDLADDQLGALAGLLRSNFSERYAVFEEALNVHRHQNHMKLEILRALAMTPREEVLGKINHYLADQSLVAKDDSSTPIRVWREVYHSNKNIVYSHAGVGEVVAFVKQNWDRPGVASEALVTLEEAGRASKEIKTEIRTAMNDLLKNNPPDYLKSLSEKILVAARK